MQFYFKAQSQHGHSMLNVLWNLLGTDHSLATRHSLTRALHSHAGARIATARGHTLSDAHRAYDDDLPPPLRVSHPPPSPALCLFAPAVRAVALINLCDPPVRVYAFCSTTIRGVTSGGGK